MMGAYTFAKNCVLRYGPGGTFGSSIIKWEVWNEPDTASGNAGRTDDALGTISTGFAGGGPFAKLQMLYSDYAEILRCMCLGIRAAATTLGFSAEIYGFTNGGIDTSYIKGVVDWCASNGYANPLTLVDAVSCHIYASLDPTTLPAGTYPPGPDNPVINGSGQTRPRQVTTLGALRQYLDASTPGGVGPKIGISEGGYRGHDSYNQYRTTTLVGQTPLPAATIHAADTSLFNSFGNIFIEPVSTTVVGPISVNSTTISLASSLGFVTVGSITVLNTLGVLVTITYTGISGNKLTGCQSNYTGTIANGASVTGTTQVIAYTSKDSTHFKGCTGGSGTLADGTVLETTQQGNIIYASPDAASGNPDQATWGLSTIEVIQQHNSYWRVDLFTSYEVLSSRFPINTNDISTFETDALGVAWDTSSATYTGALPMRFWKPWGVFFSRRVAEYGLNTQGPSGTPAGTFTLHNPSGSTLHIRNAE
jgi:hypothetical protein